MNVLRSFEYVPGEFLIISPGTSYNELLIVLRTGIKHLFESGFGDF